MVKKGEECFTQDFICLPTRETTFEDGSDVMFSQWLEYD